MRGHGKLHFLV